MTSPTARALIVLLWRAGLRINEAGGARWARQRSSSRNSTGPVNAAVVTTVGHGFGVAAGRDDCVAGGERGLRDVDAHAAAGASHELNPLASHLLQSFLACLEATEVTEGRLAEYVGNFS